MAASNVSYSFPNLYTFVMDAERFAKYDNPNSEFYETMIAIRKHKVAVAILVMDGKTKGEEFLSHFDELEKLNCKGAIDLFFTHGYWT